MEQETIRRGPELEEVSRGSVILGVIGAFLGAVPWFLASTFTNFFIGYLGFLIGWAAAFGYSKLHGRKSFPLAMVTVAVPSALSGHAKLYGKDGKVLFKFTQAMQNQALLMQYLAEHNVPLRG